MCERKDPLVPTVAVITSIRRDTPDVKTFRVALPDGSKPFSHIPGQCAMLSVPGLGEAMFSITSSPTEPFMEFSIKKCGALTDWLHAAQEGQPIALRGPLGNGFPVEGEDFLGHDLLFVAGGIGLAPLHSVINYARATPDRYGKLTVVYGARSKEDLVDAGEILRVWQSDPHLDVRLTIDRAQEGWEGHVGFVPDYVKELSPDPTATAVLCGPPIMIKFTLAALRELGFPENRIYTTLEMRMKCGIGKCGRCNIGSKYVCRDGPVFRLDTLGTLPDEY